MATTQQTASERIAEEVTSWPGVEAGLGRRGEYGFRYGRKELGHLHGDHAAHFGFPRAVWQELYDSRRIEGEEDVRDVIAMLRLNYERAVA